jgi:hypothetical protein
MENKAPILSEKTPCHSRENSMIVDVAPLSICAFKIEK